MQATDFLRNHGEDEPSGPNLEYDAAYQAMEEAAKFQEERQAGTEILPGAEPDPREIVKAAVVVLEQSHDLRAAVHYAYGRTRMDGFEGLADATTCIRGFLEDYWATCHPELDADDDDDPTMRVNAVLGLCASDTVMHAVRMAPLTRSNAFGMINLRQLAIVDGELQLPEGSEETVDPNAVNAAFRDTDPEMLAGIAQAARTTLDNLKAIDAVFDTQTPGQGPDLSPILKLVNKAAARLTQETGGEEDLAAGDDPDGDGATEDGQGASGAGGNRAAAAPGTINSRDDVVRTLDLIMQYYSRHEPSSPLPILLNRAKRLVGADFLTIMKDLAPLGIENVHVVGGIEDGDEE